MKAARQDESQEDESQVETMERVTEAEILTPDIVWQQEIAELRHSIEKERLAADLDKARAIRGGLRVAMVHARIQEDHFDRVLERGATLDRAERDANCRHASEVVINILRLTTNFPARGRLEFVSNRPIWNRPPDEL